MENEYLEVLRARERGLERSGARVLGWRPSHCEQFEPYPFDPLRGKMTSETRSELVRKYAWAIPNAAAIERLGAFSSKVVEIGGGTGYWAHLLQQAGIDVLTYDAHEPGPDHPYHHNAVWTFLHYAPHTAVIEHPDRMLFLCWPPYDDPMASETLRAYQGDKVAYVGEGWGGCTGDAAFFELLEEQWEEVDAVAIPQYAGIHDALTLYTRKGPPRPVPTRQIDWEDA